MPIGESSAGTAPSSTYHKLSLSTDASSLLDELGFGPTCTTGVLAQLASVRSLASPCFTERANLSGLCTCSTCNSPDLRTIAVATVVHGLHLRQSEFDISKAVVANVVRARKGAACVHCADDAALEGTDGDDAPFVVAAHGEFELGFLWLEAVQHIYRGYVHSLKCPWDVHSVLRECGFSREAEIEHLMRVTALAYPTYQQLEGFVDSSQQPSPGQVRTWDANFASVATVLHGQRNGHSEEQILRDIHDNWCRVTGWHMLSALAPTAADRPPSQASNQQLLLQAIPLDVKAAARMTQFIDFSALSPTEQVKDRNWIAAVQFGSQAEDRAASFIHTDLPRPWDTSSVLAELRFGLHHGDIPSQLRDMARVVVPMYNAHEGYTSEEGFHHSPPGVDRNVDTSYVSLATVIDGIRNGKSKSVIAADVHTNWCRVAGWHFTGAILGAADKADKDLLCAYVRKDKPQRVLQFLPYSLLTRSEQAHDEAWVDVYLQPAAKHGWPTSPDTWEKGYGTRSRGPAKIPVVVSGTSTRAVAPTASAAAGAGGGTAGAPASGPFGTSTNALRPASSQSASSAAAADGGMAAGERHR